MTDGVNHQAVRDAVAFWWEHRSRPRGMYEPGALVGYMPLGKRSPILQELAGRVGRVMRVTDVDQRLVQFGGEEDGTVIIRIAATLEELLPI